MHKDFRAYRIAVSFHHSCRSLMLPAYLQDQLIRASGSVALNLAEGSGRISARDQRKFYAIALGSIRECQAVLDLSPKQFPELIKQSDLLGDHVFRLVHPK